MPRAIIIHGFAGHPDQAWLPWLKDELTKNNWQVIVPTMPNPAQPEITDWVYAIMNAVDIPDLNTVLIGYALGGTAILHYLQHILPSYQVAGTVLVGSPTVGTEREILKPFFTTQFNWQKIKLSCRQLVGIYADEDPMVDLAQGELLAKQTNAKLLVVHQRTHFANDITTLPVALDAITRIPLG